MKNLFLIITLLLSLSVFSQEDSWGKYKFNVKVYDLNNKKIGKGTYIYATDSTLVLNNSGDNLVFLLKDIGKLKTKSTAGYILEQASKGAIIGSAFGLYGSDFNLLSVLEGVGIGIGIGFIVGATIGIIYDISSLNPYYYEINGEQEKWNAFREKWNTLSDRVFTRQHNKQLKKQKGNQ
ncbi:hypothetical protein ACFS5J_12065 [Flavobacterium chuncheonense]|uniref:Glycine zipper family protein n=1 Tax=Flavobacterium chuncheonense TaxID=2026653 RepID=A0ABW5YNY2_9FLAO